MRAQAPVYSTAARYTARDKENMFAMQARESRRAQNNIETR